MRKITIFAIFLIAIPVSYPKVLINEIMPNPVADESLNEWIEIYNNGTEAVNVSSWVMGDDSGNDTLQGGLYNGEGTIMEPFGFAIITDDNTRVYNNFNVSPDAIKLYVDDSSIGNGLLNDGETIYLYFNSTLMDYAAYPEVKEGFSASLVNNSWIQANPTPGYANQNSLNPSSCDYDIAIILSRTIFESKDFSFRLASTRITGGNANITGTAKIENFFGEVVKEYSPWTNDSISTKKTSGNYSPNLPAGAYTISANLSTSCLDYHQENNFAQEIFTIKGEKPKSESDIKINKILDMGTDDAAKFGQIIRAEIEVYKGNTNKKVISAWAEDKKGKRISKQSRASIEEKFTRQRLTLPIQLVPNCDNELEDGKYIVVAEGIDGSDEEKFEVEGITKTQCIEIKSNESSKKSDKGSKKEPKAAAEKSNAKNSIKSKTSKENLNHPKNEIKIESPAARLLVVEPKIIFESSSEKSRNLVPVFLIFLSIILNIILIWKR